jgi:N-carbamoylputrescine amidase
MKVKVAACQVKTVPGDVEGNLSKAREWVKQAGDKGARLAVLPEVFNTGYSFHDRNFELAENIPGPTTGFMQKLSAEHGIYIGFGMIEREGDEFFNTMVMAGPEGILGKYRKRHVYATENSFWKPGDENSIVQAGELGRIGLGICADMLYRDMWEEYRGQVDLIAISSSWPDLSESRLSILPGLTARSRELTRTLPRQISRLLGVPVIYANASSRVDTGIPYVRGFRLVCPCAGNSSVSDGDMYKMAETRHGEELILAEVEIKPNEEKKTESVRKWLTGTSSLDRFVILKLERIGWFFGQKIYYPGHKSRAPSLSTRD